MTTDTTNTANAVRTNRALDVSALTPSGYGFRGAPLYTLAGQEWEMNEPGTQLKCCYGSEGNWTWVDISPSHYGPTAISWNWTRIIAAGVYARHAGQAPTIEEAAQTGASYEPTPVEICGHQWLELSGSSWIAVIDGEKAAIWSPVNAPNSDTFYWERTLKAAEPVTATFGGRDLSGSTPTLAEAAAAVHAAPGKLALAALAFLSGASGEKGEEFTRGWKMGREAMKASFLSAAAALTTEA